MILKKVNEYLDIVSLYEEDMSEDKTKERHRGQTLVKTHATCELNIVT